MRSVDILAAYDYGHDYGHNLAEAPTRQPCHPARPAQRIGHAASRLFKKDGFDSVTVDQIVAAAGVSKGTFFNFFPTKSDALIVYFNELDGRLAELRSTSTPPGP